MTESEVIERLRPVVETLCSCINDLSKRIDNLLNSEVDNRCRVSDSVQLRAMYDSLAALRAVRDKLSRQFPTLFTD